ncbi:MAG: chromosomal replication initiator protein DnaA [Bacteroidales bacterium]|nr:chromosomal replication initiator protein DnaA [Bacteroidales bacterium]
MEQRMNEQGRHIDTWNNCLRIIEQIIDPQKFDTWFRPIKPVSLVDDVLTIEVPSDFFREYLEGAFLDIIKKTLQRVIGSGAKLVYTFRPVRREEAMRLPASQGVPPTNRTVAITSYHPSENPSPFVFPGIQKVQINPRLNPVYCFENLVEGECNKMGVTAGESISLSPGKTPFNPLFLFGGSGLGKTHIAQAIGLAIKEKYPDLVVLYVTGNEFKTQYMDAVTVRNKLTDFLAYYMKIDVLIVDDIQDLVGQGTHTAFFNIFNHLHQNGKQLILTSDRAPVDLQNFEDRLLSRFKWGLSVELRRPDYQTRLAMLKARCFREGVPVSDKVLEFLATRIKSNFRELEGALISLIAHATLTHQEDSIELAERITGHIIEDEQNDLSIDRIQSAVCDYFNLTRETLVSPSRKRQIVQARQIAMYLCRNLISNCSLSAIGAEIGGKDHATVLHACTTVSDLMSTDRVFKQYVCDIERMLVPADR